MILISDSAYEDLLAGKIRANKMRIPSAEEKSCTLYLNTLVTFRADLVPALVKRLLTEVRAAVDARGLKISSVFCIPVNPIIERKLSRMGFVSKGFYRGKYCVMGAGASGLPRVRLWQLYFPNH
jgi:hypothetical protein